MTKIVIIGAGVIGLYTAYLLLEKGYQDITIYTKHVPGDLSFEYASPFAGAIVTFAEEEDNATQYAYKFTFENLAKLQGILGGAESGIDSTFHYDYFLDRPSDKSLQFFRSYNSTSYEIPKEELTSDTGYGMVYQTFVFNSPMFLNRIFNYLKSKGVKIIVKDIKHIKDSFEPGAVVFNCTGLGSLTLGGVEDSKCHPTRAQVVVLKAPDIHGIYHYRGNTADYVIRRPYSDEVILGGFYQRGCWDKDVKGFETEDIFNRVTKRYPILKPGQTIQDLEVKRVASAFRPGREGGARIEKELIDGTLVIHNYGAEGTGYTQGLGMADLAIKFLNSSKL